MFGKKSLASSASAARSQAADNEVTELRASQAELQAEVERLKGAQEETATLLRAEVQRLQEEIARSASAQDDAAAADEERKKALDAIREASESGLQLLVEDLQAVRRDMAEARSEASGATAAAQEESRGALEELRASLARASEDLAAKLGEADARLQGALAEQAAKAEAEVLDAATRASARYTAMQGSLDEVAKEIRELRDATNSSLSDHGKVVGDELQAFREEMESKVRDSLQDAEDSRLALAAATERTLADYKVAIGNAAKAVEGTFTRSISWQARGFKRRLAQLLETEQVIRSPDFSLSCLPEMRLEVRMSMDVDDDDAMDGGPPTAPALPLPGACAVGVWAPPGLRMVFRLTLGDGPTAVARRVEHRFPHGAKTDDAGRVLYLCPHFCQLNQVWVKQGDVVQVLFELLEFQCPPLPIAATAFCMEGLEARGEAEEEEGECEAAEASAADAPADTEGAPPPENDEEEEVPELEELFPPIGPSASRESDYLEFVRSLTAEELMHDRLSSELAAVKNRSVRRVEWTLQGCSRLLECRVGEAIDSPIFSAAGLERIQFHFYPRDTTATGTNSQPCALFVSGPGRTSLKGMLWVGSQSRSFEHRYQRRGDTAGRARFCLLEHQVDCSDTVTLAIDIAEVEADLPDQASASLCLRDARSQGGGKAAASTGGEASPAQPLSGTKGILKMKRADPSKTEEFVKSISLPTLNARQLKLPLVMKAGPRGF